MARASRDAWVKRLERWKDSGLTTEEFARETGVSARSLAWWRWRLNAETRERSAEAKEQPATARRRRAKRTGADDAPAATPITFVEVAAPASSEPFEVLLVSGRRIRVPAGFDARAFERLVAILERTA